MGRRIEPVPETAELVEEPYQISPKELKKLIKQVSDVLACQGGGSLGHQLRAQTKRGFPAFLLCAFVFIGMPLLYVVVMCIASAQRDTWDEPSAVLQRHTQFPEVRRAETVNPPEVRRAQLVNPAH